MKKTFKFNVALVLVLLFCVSRQAVLPDQVIEIFRHGARGPNTDYDPQWPHSELGQLTKTGMVQHYNLGKAIAEKYPNLVESGYNPEDVYVLSNYVQRCIESTMVQVSSMFRGKTSTVKGSSLDRMQASLIAQYESLLPASEAERGDYVPVKVNVVSTLEEKLFFNGRGGGFCNKLSDFIIENEDSTKMKDAWKTFRKPVVQANSQLPDGMRIKSMEGLTRAFDTFVANVFDNKQLPGDISDHKLIESLNYGSAFNVYLKEHNQLIQRQLTSFHTIEGVLEQMANFRAGRNAKKLALYGGHDMNIYAVLAAFGVVTEECLLANYESHTKDEAIAFSNCQFPEFASHLIFEFYNQTSNPYVKVYYNDVLVPLCDGQDSCSYSDFRALAKNAGGNNTLSSWDKQCGNSNKTLTTMLIVGPVLGGFVIISLIVSLVYLKKKASRKLTKVTKPEELIIITSVEREASSNLITN